MGYKCEHCKNYYDDDFDHSDCYGSELYVPYTIADKIRDMTDEELAKFLLTFKNTFGEEYEGETSCLDWLKSLA